MGKTKRESRNGTKPSDSLADDEMRFRTGVVLRIVQPSVFAVMEVQRQMKSEMPAVPMVRNDDQDRDEPNETDPDYKKALLEHVALLGERLYNVAIATGTEIVSVPEDFPDVESTVWSDDLLYMGITASLTGRSRHADWIKYTVAVTDSEYKELLHAVMGRLGTTEKEVAEALDTFQGLAKRGVPDGVGSP